jgi:predicted deacylase
MLGEATTRDGWIRHLLNTRITVIVPIANADGFSHNRREEVGIDPNRDFAFDVAVRDQALAMHSLASPRQPTRC